MRLAAYGGISSSLATAVILAAFQQRPNFYSACVYLSQSNACLLILANMGVFLTILLGFAVQRLFFGHLRAIEEAHLRERTWIAVTETFLAMTVFRDEFNTRFVVMFVSLLFIKCFHWICQDRIDYMEQFTTIPWHFHVRMVCAMLMFLAADAAFVSHAIDYTIQRGASMMIMFGFEFTLLATTLTTIFVKYILNVIDSRHTEAWENRSTYMFYLELVTDFFKLVTYLVFFSIILTYYGLPLHIIRDVYVTLRSFGKKVMSFIRYRQATAHMNERYPDATPEELEATGDRTCIICREQMVHGGEPGRERTRPKKLRCGHILHFHCLRSWLERQQTCPTCRRPVLEETAPRPPPVAPMPQPPPPRPGFQGPVPIPIQMPNAPPPAVPPTANGPRPTPRIVINTPITLPPGYALPPGWAVIPAHNIQIVPPNTQNQTPIGVQMIPSPTHQVAPTGSAPNVAGTTGDVTGGAQSANNADHVSPPSGQTAVRSDGTNMPTTSSSTSSSTSINMPTAIQQPPQIPSAGSGIWANRSQHPLFPLAVPLFGTPGPQNRSAQPQTSAPSSDQREAEERLTAAANQLNESIKAMQDIVAQMSSIISSHQTQTQINARISTSAPSTPVIHPSTSTSNGHMHSSPPPLNIPRRRSFTHGHKRHTDHSPPPVSPRHHRLSTSEDDLMIEERADIRAPWADHPDQDECLPLQEVGSPPRRSSTSSPHRSLRRRPSLLRNDITDDIVVDDGHMGRSLHHAMDGETQVEGESVDKGKGKAVFVEDVPEHD